MDYNAEAMIKEAMKLNIQHQYQEALDILSLIPEKDGQWYYVNSYANSCLGNNIIAHEMLVKAVALVPDNTEYKMTSPMLIIPL